MDTIMICYSYQSTQSLVTLPNMLDSGYNLNKTVFLGNDKLV